MPGLAQLIFTKTSDTDTPIINIIDINIKRMVTESRKKHIKLDYIECYDMRRPGLRHTHDSVWRSTGLGHVTWT